MKRRPVVLYGDSERENIIAHDRFHRKGLSPKQLRSVALEYRSMSLCWS